MLDSFLKSAGSSLHDQLKAPATFGRTGEAGEPAIDVVAECRAVLLRFVDGAFARPLG
jgi:hypothetical protein